MSNSFILSRSIVYLLFIGHLLIATGFAVGQDAKRAVKETPLGEYDVASFDPQKPTFWISRDGRHAAYQTEKGIVVDGVAKEYAYGVKEKSFAFSPDSQRHAYVAITDDNGRSEVLVVDGVAGGTPYSSVGAGPVFSPDSKHVGCIARLRASSFDSAPIIDGREGKPEKGHAWESAFSADSKRFVYGVEIGENYSMRSDSVDGSEPSIDRPHAPYKLIDNFFFGPANQLGYIGKARDQKRFVVYDGNEDPQRFEEIDRDDVFVSENGKGMAYVAEPSSFRNVVVHNGKAGKVYDDYMDGTLAISPDGKHWGYGVELRNQECVVLDGVEQKRYETVSGPVYSPDSARVAYLAVMGDKVISVVNGKEGKGYDDRGLPSFSPDSQSAAFWAQSGGKSFVVANGKKQKDYEDVGQPYFSPDGAHIAYLAMANGKWMLVVDDQEGKPYDDIKGRFYFSPDGKHIAIVAMEGDRERVVVDGVEGNAYDAVVTLGGLGKVHFDAPDGIHYLAQKGGALVLVEEAFAAE